MTGTNNTIPTEYIFLAETRSDAGRLAEELNRRGFAAILVPPVSRSREWTVVGRASVDFSNGRVLIEALDELARATGTVLEYGGPLESPESEWPPHSVVSIDQLALSAEPPSDVMAVSVHFGARSKRAAHGFGEALAEMGFRVDCCAAHLFDVDCLGAAPWSVSASGTVRHAEFGALIDLIDRLAAESKVRFESRTTLPDGNWPADEYPTVSVPAMAQVA